MRLLSFRHGAYPWAGLPDPVKKTGGPDIRAAEIIYGYGDAAADGGTEVVDDFMVIFLHPLFDPIQHDSHKTIFIEVRDEIFICIGELHTL